MWRTIDILMAAFIGLCLYGAIDSDAAVSLLHAIGSAIMAIASHYS